jgi:hypothetical protein
MTAKILSVFARNIDNLSGHCPFHAGSGILPGCAVAFLHELLPVKNH